MIQVVTGGSGSGKSAYAEEQILTLGDAKRIYIATMQSYDDESDRRIARHRTMRQGKGFHTIECYTGLEQLEIECGANVLLECMSNLTANEMFQYEDEGKHAEAVCYNIEEMGKQANTAGYSIEETEMLQTMNRERTVSHILAGVQHLAAQAANLIIVTNEIFSDGMAYEMETEQYLRCLGEINCRLGQMADQVTEVVYGIPVSIGIRGGSNETNLE